MTGECRQTVISIDIGTGDCTVAGHLLYCPSSCGQCRQPPVNVNSVQYRSLIVTWICFLYRIDGEWQSSEEKLWNLKKRVVDISRYFLYAFDTISVAPVYQGDCSHIQDKRNYKKGNFYGKENMSIS
jgi:hypothetical protein